MGDLLLFCYRRRQWKMLVLISNEGARNAESKSRGIVPSPVGKGPTRGTELPLPGLLPSCEPLRGCSLTTGYPHLPLSSVHTPFAPGGRRITWAELNPLYNLMRFGETDSFHNLKCAKNIHNPTFNSPWCPTGTAYM